MCENSQRKLSTHAPDHDPEHRPLSQNGFLVKFGGSASNDVEIRSRQVLHTATHIHACPHEHSLLRKHIRH